MSSGATIAKNAVWLMVATAAQKLVAFIAFTVVARLIGRELTGVFFYSVSITSIFVIFMDLGMTPVVIRSLAGNREDAPRLLGAALRAKLLLAPFAIAAALLYAALFGADRQTLATVAVACLVMTADTFHLALYGAMRGRQNLRPEAFGMFIGQILTAITSVAAAFLGYGPVGLAVALLVGSVWNVGWSAVQSRRFRVAISRPRRADLRRLAKEALPFGIAGIAVKVYSYVDSLFLQQFHGSSAVGVYAVAYKLTYALQFLPLTFTAALYPALASLFAAKREAEMRNTFFGSLRIMAAVGFPLSAGLSALSPRLIPLLYGQEFVGAIPAFSVLPWVLLPIFLDFPIGSLLNASHRAHLKTTAMVATMVLNIAANAVLVPAYGPLGAAWAGVVSFWALYAIGVWFTRELVGGVRRFVWLTARAFVAAGLSWVAWRMIGDRMDIQAAIVFGGAVAVLLAFVLKLVLVEDVFKVIRRLRRVEPSIEPLHE
ncbi:flippase [Candidatus Uhrbacteria bacterium]|nr:flippase [Candidatus Uhrbacteria bacterium]